MEGLERRKQKRRGATATRQILWQMKLTASFYWLTSWYVNDYLASKWRCYEDPGAKLQVAPFIKSPKPNRAIVNITNYWND